MILDWFQANCTTWKFHYLVTYMATNDIGSCSGCITITLNEPWNTTSHIDVANYIKDYDPEDAFHSVSITGFTRVPMAMNDDGGDTGDEEE